MKCVLLFSGGLDSAVALYSLRDAGHEVICVGVDYAQPHRLETACAQELCNSLGVTYLHASVPEMTFPGWHGSASVVPGRNLVFLALAASVAVQHKADAVVIGTNATDHADYPDCRLEFLEAARRVLKLGYDLRLEAPLSELTKTEVVQLGVRLEVPFAATWSCYRGGDAPCGDCGACEVRAQAFSELGIPDPLLETME